MYYSRLKDLREDADLTQSQVSKKLHCTQQTYSNYETGARDLPTAVLIQLAQLYGVSADYILGLKDTKK